MDHLYGMDRQRAFSIMADVVDELMRGLRTLEDVRQTLKTVELCVVAMTILMYTVVILGLIVGLAYVFSRKSNCAVDSADIVYAQMNPASSRSSLRERATVKPANNAFRTNSTVSHRVGDTIRFNAIPTMSPTKIRAIPHIQPAQQFQIEEASPETDEDPDPIIMTTSQDMGSTKQLVDRSVEADDGSRCQIVMTEDIV